MTIRRKLNSFDAAFCGRKTIESRTNHMKYLTILLVTVPLNIITFSTSFFVPCLCVTLSLSFFASLHLSICRLLVSIVCNCNEIVWPTKTIFSLLCSFDLATRKYRMAKLSSHAHNPNCRVFFIFKPLASSSPWSPMTPTIRKHTKKEEEEEEGKQIVYWFWFMRLNGQLLLQLLLLLLLLPTLLLLLLAVSRSFSHSINFISWLHWP